MRAWLDGIEVGEQLGDPGAPSASSPSVRGVFETLRVVDGQPFALSRHLRRMAGSVERLALPPVDLACVRRLVGECSRSLGPPSRLRLTWSQGPSGPGPGGLLTVTTSPLPESGGSVALVTVPWRRNARGLTSPHKTTSYAESVVAAAHARRHGADEGVLLTEAGLVSEGTATNVFHVVGGELRTSSLATGCLPGITRALVLEWFGAREVDATLEEVRAADEVFVTSSTRGPVPVRRWDDRAWPGPGPVTRVLVQEWDERVAATPDP